MHKFDYVYTVTVSRDFAFLSDQFLWVKQIFCFEVFKKHAKFNLLTQALSLVTNEALCINYKKLRKAENALTTRAFKIEVLLFAQFFIDHQKIFQKNKQIRIRI